MKNPELVLYPLKFLSASLTFEILRYFKFCDSSKQELTGHLKLLVWGASQNTRGAVLWFAVEGCSSPQELKKTVNTETNQGYLKVKIRLIESDVNCFDSPIFLVLQKVLLILAFFVVFLAHLNKRGKEVFVGPHYAVDSMIHIFFCLNSFIMWYKLGESKVK